MIIWEILLKPSLKGFEMAGIKEALEMEFPSEDPFADLDS